MIRANFHTHTTFCDGKDTPRAMAERALALGFEQLGYSGHMDPDIHMDFPAYLAEIRALREAYAGRLDILCGVELDQRWDPADVAGAEYVIGSTHFLSGEDGAPVALDHTAEKQETLCRTVCGGDWYRLCAAYFAEEARVWERTRCDIVGHFDLIARFNHRVPRFDEADPRYLGPALESLDALADTGAAFEVNAGAWNRGRRRDFYPIAPLLRRLAERRVPIFLSTDAHSADKLDAGLAEAAAMAAACGHRTYCILRHGPDGGVIREERPLDRAV